MPALAINVVVSQLATHNYTEIKKCKKKKLNQTFSLVLVIGAFSTSIFIRGHAHPNA